MRRDHKRPGQMQPPTRDLLAASLPLEVPPSVDAAAELAGHSRQFCILPKGEKERRRAANARAKAARKQNRPMYRAGRPS